MAVKELGPKTVLVTESQFLAALRVTILERLALKSLELTEENIRQFELRARNNWVRAKDGREFPEWHFVLHDAAILSIKMATK